MASLNFPVVLRADDNGAILVTFPDIPEAATYGDGRADALAHAVDALDAAITFRVRDKEDIPTPSPARAGDQHTPREPACGHFGARRSASRS